MKNPFDTLMPIAPRPDIVFVEGDGVWLIDSEGRRYIAFTQGWAVNALGHGHPAIVKAIQRPAARLINPSPAFYNQPMVDLAQKLVINSAFDQVFFTNSGAEANCPIPCDYIPKRSDPLFRAREVLEALLAGRNPHSSPGDRA